MSHPLLSIQNLSVHFTAEGQINQAIENISFDVKKGEIVALVGESGSGKSVTSLSILQLLPTGSAHIVSGRILFSQTGTEAIDLLKHTSKQLKQIRGNKIAMIFQEPMTSLNPLFTCGYQVAETLKTHQNISLSEAKKQVIEWFKKVKLPQPESIYHRYPHQLSGGQKQRVMIAMAMCCNPLLLICDEPTTALDVTVQKSVLKLIKELQQETGMGIIFITHDLGIVAQIADRAIVMYKGSVEEEGSISRLFSQPQQAYSRALLACRPANHPRGTRLPVVSDFINTDNGKVESTPLKTEFAPISQVPVIKVQHLSVHYPNKKNWLGQPIRFTKALNDVSFEVYEHETLGIVGESGCGKTTLGRALLQLIPITAGSIIYKDQALNQCTTKQLRQLRRHLQIVFQDPYASLNPRKKIGDAIAEPLAVHGIITNAAERKKKVEQFLEKVGLLPAHYHRYPHEFSGGQRQRIVIARALVLQPSFLICDESVSALDVSVQAQVLNLLNDLKKEMRFTIVFISHDLSVVRYLCNRIIVMNQGWIEEMGAADAIYLHPRSIYTQTLIDSIPKIS